MNRPQSRRGLKSPPAAFSPSCSVDHAAPIDTAPAARSLLRHRDAHPRARSSDTISTEAAMRKFLLAGAFVLTAASSSGAAPLCVAGSLADYISLAGGC